MYARDLELYIPDCNKIVEITKFTHKGNPVIGSLIFSKETGQLINRVLKHAKHGAYCKLCYDHPLLKTEN
jgi:hypothetical protein